MFKRLFWLLIGFGMSFWMMRAVRDRLARLTPDAVALEVAKALRSLGRDLRVAISEGAEAMREREAELREQIQTPTPS